jgi:hypothetical protein
MNHDIEERENLKFEIDSNKSHGCRESKYSFSLKWVFLK